MSLNFIIVSCFMVFWDCSNFSRHNTHILQLDFLSHMLLHVTAFKLAIYVIFMTLDPSTKPARFEATSFPSGFLRL